MPHLCKALYNNTLANPSTSASITTSPKEPKIYKMASAQKYPPGGTFFDTLKRNFTQVPVNQDKDNAIATSEFLEAAESLTTLFGMLT